MMGTEAPVKADMFTTIDFTAENLESIAYQLASIGYPKSYTQIINNGWVYFFRYANRLEIHDVRIVAQVREHVTVIRSQDV